MPIAIVLALVRQGGYPVFRWLVTLAVDASADVAYQTGEWTAQYREVYVFAGTIYFLIALSLSRYGAFVERRFGVSER